MQSLWKRVMSGALVALLSLPLATKPLQAAEPTFVMAYIHAKTNYSELVAGINHAVHEVSVDWLGVNAQGHLIIDEKKYNPAFIDEMHALGIKVVPMLSNGFDRNLGALALRNAEALTDEIAAMVYERNFDGINYDFENLSEHQRDAQTHFIQLLKQKMPDKSVSMAVCANPSGWTSGWHASYDMEALAKVADYLMLMAYDEGYSGGPEKPVASLTFVENCIKDLLDRGVPSDKIVLGIPHYGRLWSHDGSQLGLGVELTAAEKILQSDQLTNKELEYDSIAQAAKLTFTATSPYPLYSWKDIPAGSYTLWFENEQSLQAKIAFVERYHLKGVGVWSLGQADPSYWNLIVPGSVDPSSSQHTNSSPEDDLSLDAVPKAPDNNPSGEDSLIEVPTEDIAQSVPPTLDDSAVQDTELSLAQDSLPDTKANTETVRPEPLEYADVSTHWAKEDIHQAASEGWLSWVIGNRFFPEQGVYRDQIAASLQSFFMLPSIPSQDIMLFNDITDIHWAWDSIQSVVYAGIMGGTSVGEQNAFSPDLFFTRAQFASVFDRLFTQAEQQQNRSIVWEDLSNIYSDITEEHWAFVPILRMTERGLLSGYEEDGYVMKPDQPITRAELTVLLSRMRVWFPVENAGQDFRVQPK